MTQIFQEQHEEGRKRSRHDHLGLLKQEKNQNAQWETPQNWGFIYKAASIAAANIVSWVNRELLLNEHKERRPSESSVQNPFVSLCTTTVISIQGRSESDFNAVHASESPTT